ncbi:hypothetical protein Cfla_3706 [Cellulomonas flavigena DSM 20109]|uniref:Uncharacterized protein n=1 Tax=Cellulomonas flavigena (strain ATCC 482 / DSM 20109 / BCRC 11376 / JCM 18109 / NBRC 3775 / NCIMB 8073 / NRS 134) TaxID=446466 RepID=D5UE98_CELFN|nr:hypothetical protein [Cellulomonas flavigena]ADG76574.1 hypothetical protein Cfla_3706 [Cellulomonas flavigena DSM 20109]
MTDDLTARLERALHVQEHHERDLQPDPATLAGLHARVARVRRGRTVSWAAVAAAAVGVLGVGGWFGLQDRTTPEPADPPTPTVSATPSPTPEPSAVASAPAAPLVPVTLPGMPPMYEPPEGLLEQTGPGWFLTLYTSTLYEPLPGDGQRNALVLSAPTGELYHLADLGGYTRLLRWDTPGTARLEINHDGAGGRLVTVDLTTGGLTYDDRVPDGAEWLGTAGADELWLAQGLQGSQGTLYVLPPDGPVRSVPTRLDRAVVSPDGRTILGRPSGEPIEALDVATGRHTAVPSPAGQSCDIVDWIDATGVMAACVDTPPEPLEERWNYDEHDGQVVRLDATGGPAQTLTTLRADGVVPAAGAHVRDGVLVTTAYPQLSSTPDSCYDVCVGGAYLWDGGDVRPVVPAQDLGGDVCEVHAASTGLLLRTGAQCYEWVGDQWWLVDEATGAARLVGPVVGDELGLAPVWVVERG